MIARVVHPRLGEIPVVGTPVKFSRMNAGVRRAAPQQGQHTDEILAEYAYSPADIAALRAKHVVV
jgi:crotonobetainyl-CoA:carnitine CoA-transferase CaiB-like acyl-CoA transferase